MTVKLRLAAVALTLLIPALVVGRWTLATGATARPVAPPPLPRQVGPWTLSAAQEFEAEVLSVIEPDAYLMRLYEAPQRSPIWLYVGLYAGRAGYGKGAHDPEACYPAHGWEVLGSRSIELPLADARSLRSRLLDFHKENLKEVVLYWFQPAGRWPTRAAAEELLRIFDAAAGRPQYAFVRLSAASDGNPGVSRDLAEFAAEIAPAVRTAVERIHDGSSESIGWSR